MAWTMAGLMGAAWRILRLSSEPPITRQMLRLIGKPFTISTRKAQDELGYAPQITMKEGLAAMRQPDADFAGLADHWGDRRAVAVS